MKLTRRFFTQMFVGICLSMPVLQAKTFIPKTDVVFEKAGPLSPLRKEWPPLDMEDFQFRLGMNWSRYEDSFSLSE